MTGYERSWRPLSLIHKPPPHNSPPAPLAVSFRKPCRNETSRKHPVHNRKPEPVTL